MKKKLVAFIGLSCCYATSAEYAPENLTEEEQIAWALAASIVDEEDEMSLAVALSIQSHEEKQDQERQNNDEEIACMLQFEEEYNQDTPHHSHNIMPNKNNHLFNAVQMSILTSNEGKESLTKFKEIYQHLEGIQSGSDVHVLDNYVFGLQGSLPSLLKIGRICAVDQGGLTWAQIKEELTAFFPGNPNDIMTNYEGVDIDKTQLMTHINTYFNQFPNELNALFGVGNSRCEEIRELWSRTIDLTRSFAVYDPTPISLLAQAIAENYLTQGGCVQGRINRIFVRYVSLLGATGLRSINRE